VTKEKFCGIYKIENITNGKIYIGSSVDIRERWRRHKKDLKKNKHHSEYLQRAWNKYGEQAFLFTVIEYVKDDCLLLEKEQYYINLYDSYHNGYNANEFSDRHMISAETKKKIGKSSKGRNIGEKSSTCKLTEEQVKLIINDLLNPNIYIWNIIEKYNTTKNTINSLYHRKSWTYLTKDIIFPKHKNGRISKISKLNDDIVKNIIEDILKKVTNDDIKDKYNISNHVINNIKQKHTWKHLTKDIDFKVSVHL
jgi:group I intron endonuclease